jgi:hypothetical protein
MSFSSVFGEEEVAEVVEELVGVVLLWSSVDLWRGWGGFYGRV